MGHGRKRRIEAKQRGNLAALYTRDSCLVRQQTWHHMLPSYTRAQAAAHVRYAGNAHASIDDIR